MEPSTTYVVLSYVGPLCGVVGFIITPGLTHIRPWLMEKLNPVKKTLTEALLVKDYSTMSSTELLREKVIFDNYYKLDLRSKIRMRKKELNIASSQHLKNISVD